MKLIRLTVKKQNRKFFENISFAFLIRQWSRYKTDPQIKAMTDLVDAYQRREVHLAEKILKGAWSNAFPQQITD